MIRLLFSNLFNSSPAMNVDNEQGAEIEIEQSKSISSGSGPHSFLITVGDWGTIKNEDGSIMCMVKDIINTARKNLLSVIKFDLSKKQTDPHTVTKTMIQLDK